MSLSRDRKKRKITHAVMPGTVKYHRPEDWLIFKNAISSAQDDSEADAMIAGLASANREFNALFQPIQSERVPGRLRHAIAFGDEDLARRILACNIEKMPSLLLEQVSFKEPSGHIITGTVYQWALKCHDVNMCKMLDDFLKQIPNWQEERQRQIREIFPDGIEACFATHQPYDFTTLVNVITNSSDADIQSALRHEYKMSMLALRLDQFRYQFAELSQQEDVFNPQHIINALIIFSEQTFLWSLNQRNLFWRQIYGYVYRFLPACYKQAFCQGLYDLTERVPPGNLARMNTILNYAYRPPRKVNIHELDADSNCRPGFDFAAYNYYAGDTLGNLFLFRGSIRVLCEANVSGLLDVCTPRMAGAKRCRA